MFAIEKKYHFHAAHRNQNLDDKCRNIHGHTYHVVVSIQDLEKTTDGVTILFSDIDKIIEPIIKGLDHTLLIDGKDPLLTWIEDFNKKCPESATTYRLFPYETSAENLARYIARQISRAGLICSVSLQETTSSIVYFYGEATPENESNN